MSKDNFFCKQVLLIDDSEIDILVNRRLMELTGFAARVIVTSTAEEALRYLMFECSKPEHAPDWIFLDMHLPGMNGFDFIEEFSKLPASVFEKTRLVVLSVFQKPEQVSQLSKHSFIAGQIEKPLTQQALRDVAAGNLRPVNVSS